MRERHVIDDRKQCMNGWRYCKLTCSSGYKGASAICSNPSYIVRELLE